MKSFRITYLLLIVVVYIAISCRQMWGDNDLGNNFSLLEGDRIEDRIIVYCSGPSVDACYSGTYIVPIYSRHMDSAGHYAEYVETAKSNDDFIIARTLQIVVKRKNYWIIRKCFNLDNCDRMNCDSIIQSNVLGPMEYSQFLIMLSELNIDLNLDKK